VLGDRRTEVEEGGGYGRLYEVSLQDEAQLR